MTALIALVDECGEAIESDLSSVHGDSLRDFLLGLRPPAEALRKISMLPPGSATSAHMQANPRPSTGGGSSPPEPWRRYVGVTATTHAVWDVWDALVATSSAGSKKKPPQHPRTTAPNTRRGRDNAARPSRRTVPGART